MRPLWTIGLLVLLTLSVQAAKTDIYFGNGILTIERDAQYNAEKILKTKIKESFGENFYNAHINNISYAYNQTKGFVRDILESGIQKILPEDPENMRVWAGSLANETMLADLSKQIEAYEQSYAQGNKVIIVAHSQGNLFANRASGDLVDPDWLHIIHIAAPTDAFRSQDIFGWDNDLVAWGGSDILTRCSIRKVTWDDAHPSIEAPEPVSNYANEKYIGRNYKLKWKIVERSSLLRLNSLVHAFTFYMGEPLKEDLANPTASMPLALQQPTPFKKIPDAYDGSDLVDTKGRDIILEYIKAQLDKNMQDNQGDTNSDNEDEENANGGDNTDPISFDYRSQCNSVEFPDPIPSELEATISGILQSNAGSLVSSVVCPLIDAAVKAYNLQHSLPGGGVSSPF